MKKTDIATIILIASMSVIVAFIATNAIFDKIVAEEVTVKTIKEISTEVVEPDEAIFNKDAINPTIEVQINTEGE